MLDVTHSAAAVGVLGFCLNAPYALLGLIGGALADRWHLQRVMTATQTAMAVCAAALAVVAYLHVDRVWVIYAIAVIRGTIMVFNNPSRQALMVELVGRAELPKAIALNSSLNNATRIVGPAIAGVLIATVGVAACFALNALSFIPRDRSPSPRCVRASSTASRGAHALCCWCRSATDSRMRATRRPS